MNTTKTQFGAKKAKVTLADFKNIDQVSTKVWIIMVGLGEFEKDQKGGDKSQDN